MTRYLVSIKMSEDYTEEWGFDTYLKALFFLLNKGDINDKLEDLQTGTTQSY